MTRTRTPYVGEVVSFPSPEDADVSFGLKRLDNGAVIAYRDKNSVVRFIFSNDDENSGENKYIQEKDYPQGTMRLDTVTLGLDSWNIVDESGAPVPVTRENIIAYTSPTELDALYDEVLKINPILTGQKAVKND